MVMVLGPGSDMGRDPDVQVCEDGEEGEEEMKIWEEHRHPDTVPKRRFTAEDIEFLKDLQKEMNEQDHFGQADPRYWVIEETERQYGNENGESCIVETDGSGFWDDMEEMQSGVRIARGLRDRFLEGGQGIFGEVCAADDVGGLGLCHFLIFLA